MPTSSHRAAADTNGDNGPRIEGGAPLVSGETAALARRHPLNRDNGQQRG